MNLVFADSFYFFALLNPRDAAHSRANAFSQSKAPGLLTTAWVVTEVADGLASTENRQLVAKLLDSLEDDPNCVVLPPSRELFAAGLDRYHRRPDKQWSLTDCISFVAMEYQGITEALTGDHHFEQAGFVALLRA